MRRILAVLFVVLATLSIVPGWTGEERLPVPNPRATVAARRVALFPDAPARRRAGALRFVGGVALSSRDWAFGGFSAIHVGADGETFTLLSDVGTVLRFRMGADWQPRATHMMQLPAGPRTGWRKRDRDAESLAVDPRTGRSWVGFESVNAIWRYAPGFARAEAHVRPRAMRKWPTGGGPESMVRLRDGRFVAIAEQAGGGRPRSGLVWHGDPTEVEPAYGFTYRPAPGYDPSDMTELPDGRLLVLERAFRLPFRWYARLMVVEREALRPGAAVTGRLLARIAPPMVDDNWEGVAAVREGRDTAIWLVSDDNQLFLQRTLLMKFRLEKGGPSGT